MQRSLRIAIVVAIAALVLPGGATQASENLQEKFAGVWELADRERASSKMKEAVEEVVSEFAFYKRPFARRRLREACSPCETIRIAFPDDEIAVTCDDKKTYESPEDGTAVRHVPGTGDPFDLEQTFDGGDIEQLHDAERGDRLTFFRLDGSDELEWDTKLTSPELPAPVEYEFEYVKR